MRLFLKTFINLVILFFLLSCANNSNQVWVADLDVDVRPKSIEKIEALNYKKEKNFLEGKKIFVFSPFIRTELLKFKEVQNFSKQLNQQNSEFLREGFFTQTSGAQNWVLENTLPPEIKTTFFSQVNFFLEDFLLFFRVNKDLSSTLYKQTQLDILLIPQILFWACEECEEENLLYLRLSVIDLKTGRLVWFSDNFHKFYSLPSQEKQKEKGAALFQVILKNFKKSFGT